MSTALVGPSEPEDRTLSLGPFSSHADEGRITRIAGRTGVWSQLAARSLARYRDIEERSGIRFHFPRSLVVSTADVDHWIDHGLVHGANIRKVQPDDLTRATGIVTGPHPIAFEGPPAGYINPRRLVAAQTALTEAAGGIIIDDQVTSLQPAGSGRFRLDGPFGAVQAKQVLVATGGFGRELIDGELDLERRPRTILLAAMPHHPELPSLIITDPADERMEGIYWVPPVRYPDGHTYLKIGGNLRTNPRLPSPTDLIEWFRSDGDKIEAEALEHSLRSLLPEVEIGAVLTSPCVVTVTPSTYPYLGWVSDGVAVAIGGNGSAAKSSDELGRLAASLFSPDGWTDSLDPSHFEPRWH